MSYQKIQWFNKYLRHIQEKDDNDLIIGSTGRKGSGKSTFSLQSTRFYIRDYFNEKSLDLNKYVAYNNDDVFDKIYSLNSHSPLVGDEAIRFAWSRDWNKSVNKDLIRMTAQIRTKKLIFYMNIPKISWIDSAYREGMLDIWIWIHASISEEGKKCYGLMFEPDENQAQTDSWHLKEMRKIYMKKKSWRIGRFTDIEKIHRFVRNHPCFVDMFEFPPLPSDIYEKYQEIRDSKVFEKQMQYIDQKEAAKVLSYNLVNKWEILNNKLNGKKISARAIADILTVNPKTKKQLVNHATVSNWIKDIKEKIGEIKQQLELEQPMEQDANDTPF